MKKLAFLISVFALIMVFAVPVSAKTYKLPKTVTYVYDGEKSSQNFYYKGGKLVKFDHDALKYKGNLITVKNNGDDVMHITCKNKVTKVDYIGTIGKVSYKNGKISQEVFYNRKGKKLSSRSYYYKNGKLFRIYKRNSKGTVVKKYCISYDTGCIIVDVGKTTYVHYITYGKYNMTKTQYKKAKALTDWWQLFLI